MNQTVDGLTIHYEVKGEGDPVLMLHGWGGSAQSFLPVIEEMAKRRRVYALDFPGFGKSDEPPEDFDLFDYEKLVLHFMDAVGIEKTDVICHSFGGRVTILLAARHPERFSRLALIDAAGLIPKRTIKYHLRVRIYKLCKRAVTNQFLYRLLKMFGIDAKERVKNAGSQDYRQASDVMKKVFVRVVNHDLFPYLKEIKSPTLLIYGENDTDTPVSFGEIMEKEIPDAGLVVIKNAGHFSYLDQFGQVMRILYSFFEVAG